MVNSNKKLEAIRMQRRWSVAVASEKAQVSINTFNRWERGLQVPQLSSLDKLCNAFGLTPEELGFGAAVAPKNETPSVKHENSSSDTSFLSPHRAVLTSTDKSFEDPLPTQPAHHTIYFEQAKRSIEDMIQIENEEDKSEDHKGITRRHAIAALVSTPAAMLSLSDKVKSPLLRPEEVLALCTTGIPLCWELYFEGGLVEVEQVLPGYLSQLTILAQSPTYQQKVSTLLSQGYQLASLLTLQRQNFGSAHTYAQEAFQIGEQLEDANLQTASLIRQAQVYLYLKRPHQRLLTYEHALQCSKQSSPLLQGRVYIGLTEAHSCVGNEDEAQRFLALAHKTFPEKCKSDPNFWYTHFDSWSLAGLEAMMYLHLKRPKQAWNLFNRVEETLPEILVPSRVELSVRKAEVSLALGEKGLACRQVQSALQSARVVGNHLRCDEAYTIYEHICTKWGRESEVKALASLFR